MNETAEFAALFKLPVEQRLQLAEDLWDSIDERNVPIRDWQLAELRRRAARYDAGEMATHDWTEVERMIDTAIAGVK